MFARLSGVRSALLTTFVSAALLAFGSSAFATCVGGAPNGTLESGEVCDEGAETPTCDNNCTTVVCGDGHRNSAAGEECDDGDSTDTDFCRNNCKYATCGDGVTCTDATGSDACANSPFLDDVETCDTAGESAACDDDCTAPGCTDGNVNQAAGEQCDDGNTQADDDCTNQCNTATCGDGIIHDLGSGTEDCDDSGESATCDADCTSAQCGDATHNVTAGEECDDGDTDSEDGCSSACIIESCGDGIVQAGLNEECDDGDAFNDDGCLSTCLWARCGDGKTCAADCVTPAAGQSNPFLTGPEECDDGNASDTDACLGTCEDASCGDGFVQQGVEGCDDGNTNNADLCPNDCVSPTCNDGIVQTEFGEQCDTGESHCVDGGDAGEVCTTNEDCRGICAGTVNPGFPCTPETVLDECGEPGVCDMTDAECDNDGVNDVHPDACRGNCQNDYCGDGVIDSGEECDGHAPGTSGPCIISNFGGAFSSVAPLNCWSATCGDEIVCSSSLCTSGPGGHAEECDDGDGGADNCLGSCALNECGDGVRDCGQDGDCDNEDDEEGCDDGAANSDTVADACRENCQPANCGDGVIDNGEDCDNGDDNGDDAACLSDCTLAACGDHKICSQGDCTTGPTGGPEACDDGNAFTGDGCDACKLENCGDNVTDVDEDCDDGGESATCNIDCTTATCGDGKVNATAGETCDDHNIVSLDGCDQNCILEFCGDGTINNHGTEQCDDGLGNSDGAPDACRTTCRDPGCGDSTTDTGETCDRGGEAADCDDDCTAVSCGDGNANEHALEECDNGAGNANVSDQCRTNCVNPKQGDGIHDPGHGEQCDKGPLGDATCNPDGCLTGAAPDSYGAGFQGGTCELDAIAHAEKCQLPGETECPGATSFNRNLGRLRTLLIRAGGKADGDHLAGAARNAGSSRKRAQRLLEGLPKLCRGASSQAIDDARICLEPKLGRYTDIMVTLEANLEAPNP